MRSIAQAGFTISHCVCGDAAVCSHRASCIASPHKIPRGSTSPDFLRSTPDVAHNGRNLVRRTFSGRPVSSTTEEPARPQQRGRRPPCQRGTGESHRILTSPDLVTTGISDIATLSKDRRKQWSSERQNVPQQGCHRQR